MRSLLTNKKHNNVLTSSLLLLGVKFTSKYTDKYFNEHPNKYDMFGLSRMLSHFGVNNIGVKIYNKEEDIHSIEPPYIAHIGSDFVVVEKVSQTNVNYYWHKKQLTVPINEFTNMWSGAILVVEADKNSMEPDYMEHRKKESFINIQKLLLHIGGIVLIAMGIYLNQIFKNFGLSLLVFLNLIGGSIGYLLVLKQMNAQSSHADKICSLFAQNECNDILDSPAAKFMGIIGWSELGFSYFLSNTFILLFAPQYLSYLVLLNICVLPYSLWSIWYQKFKAKTWCPLCLLVQVLFWAIFTINWIFGSIYAIHTLEFTLVSILSVGLIYGLPFLAINITLPYLAEGLKIEKTTQELNSLKANGKIFLSLLEQETYYSVSKQTSNILLGNPEAKNMITIFTNPHCDPCARMHVKVGNLLKDTNNKYCIQYIISSFSEELNSSNEFFIYVNRNFSTEERDQIYYEWFDKGKFKKEEFFNKYNFVPNDIISEEHQKHIDWKKQTKLRVTPIILYNGYELPKMFSQQIENLAYFTDLDVVTK